MCSSDKGGLYSMDLFSVSPSGLMVDGAGLVCGTLLADSSVSFEAQLAWSLLEKVGPWAVICSGSWGCAG